MVLSILNSISSVVGFGRYLGRLFFTHFSFDARLLFLLCAAVRPLTILLTALLFLLSCLFLRFL